MCSSQPNASIAADLCSFVPDTFQLIASAVQAGVHPEQPAHTVDRPTFERLWHHCVSLLQRGFQTGSILTVDPEEAKRLGPPWTRALLLVLFQPAPSGRVTSMVTRS